MTAAAADNYWADLAVVQITPPGGSAIPLAMVQDLELTFKSTESYARGMCSEKIKNRAKYAFQIDVKFSLIKYLPTVGSWFAYYITDPTSAGGTVVDTCKCALFTVTGEIFPMTTGNDNVLRTVTDVSFPEFPLKATYNQWVKAEFSGVGADLVDTNPVT
jgi:hypothetical protein